MARRRLPGRQGCARARESEDDTQRDDGSHHKVAEVSTDARQVLEGAGVGPGRMRASRLGTNGTHFPTPSKVSGGRPRIQSTTQRIPREGGEAMEIKRESSFVLIALVSLATPA